MKIKKGATRFVVLTKKYAFKFPRIHFKATNKWSLFLRGLLANMNENLFGVCNFPELCPVVFYLPGGFLTVMVRAEELSILDWKNFDFEKHFVTVSQDLVERKRSSFGKLNEKIVAVDYDGNGSWYNSFLKQDENK